MLHYFRAVAPPRCPSVPLLRSPTAEVRKTESPIPKSPPILTTNPLLNPNPTRPHAAAQRSRPQVHHLLAAEPHPRDPAPRLPHAPPFRHHPRHRALDDPVPRHLVRPVPGAPLRLLRLPPETYSLKYPAPGAPALAARVAAAMAAEGLHPTLDAARGWDHGVFVPLTLAVPAADIPVVQVSVLASEDPAQHLRMGRALAALREDNVAIVGSGFASFHNLGIMRSLRGFAGNSLDKNWLAFKAKTDEWNAALTEAVAPANATERADRVARWRELPHADMMHPPRGGEHFMPLIVCAGAAREEDGAAKTYKDEYMGVDIFTYYWGAPAVST
ncbi:Extradiol ring-cleavage class III subunit B [Cordyceps militaris]|uniref:Extradiol ring-cleavage class III subunit B n=1 Tax=Cordyceps militaris TaxID=73501 RepID=A0A2H4SCV2_CORMI|nr:Extradiol ring-cleavage class III subunit B [Cordyceps militaris]